MTQDNHNPWKPLIPNPKKPATETWIRVFATELEMENITIDHENGMSIRDISKKYGYARGLIKNWVGNTEAYL